MSQTVGREIATRITDLTIVLKWSSTVLNIAAGVLIALNLPASPLAFPLFALANFGWLLAAVRMREPSIALLNGAFLVINGFGCWQWLGT